MEKILTQDLKPGMVTAAPVTTRRGQELIPAGTTLTKQLISRMEFYRVAFSYVEEASVLTEEEIQAALQAARNQKLAGAQTEQTVAPSTQSSAKSTPKDEVAYSQKIKRSKTFQEYSLHSTLVTETLKRQLEGFVYNNCPMDFDALLNSVKSLITPGQTIIQYFDMLHNLRSSDDSVYGHSLNVAMISRVLGKWLKWSPSDLDSLVIAGLLHDIGKITIPPEILNKEGKLTDEEFEQIRWHPRAGYELVRDLKIDSRIAHGAEVQPF